MGAESVIIQFIQDNLKLLQQTPFPEDLYKRKKQDFFLKHKRIVGKPKDQEIARKTTFHMIKRNMLKDESSLESFLDLPFFKKNIFDSEPFYAELKLKSLDSETIIDPSKLDSEEYVSKIKGEIKDQVLSENQSVLSKKNEELEKEIMEKKNELAKIPSRLDDEIISEPEIMEEKENHEEWWQTLNLKEDPIPTQNGFQKINESYFKDIVVHTDIFDRYVNYANNIPSAIFKNTVFYGGFGSGKTAFFDYLKRILSRNKILLAYVAVWPNPDTEKIILDFKVALIDSLEYECRNFGVDVSRDFTDTPDQYIRKLFQLLHEHKGFSGFVIVVDDLHKNEIALKAVIHFISSLQIFTDSLVRHSEFDACVYIAGKPTWKKDIDFEPSLSGSIARYEIMPEVTEKDAHLMLNKRLVAFSINQERTDIVNKSFVSEIYNELKKNNAEITFRTFLQKALEQFRMKNFDKVVSINPKAINTEIIEKIRLVIQNSSKLKSQFESLQSLIQNNNEENQQNCFGILGAIYLQKKVYENSTIFDRNKWAFNHLRNSGLIMNYQDESNSTYWSITREIRLVNEEILRKYNVSMEEFLIRVFFTDAVKKNRKIHYPEINELKQIEKNVSNIDHKKIIENTIQECKKFYDIDENLILDISPNDLVNKCVDVLSAITRAFMYINGISKIDMDNSKSLLFWKGFWKKPSVIIEFIDNAVEGSPSKDATAANFIFGLCKDAIPELISFMSEQAEKNRVFALSYNNLSNDDCECIDLCRTHWINGKYYEMCEDITVYLEKKIRTNVLNIFRLFYGTTEFRYKRYAPEVTKAMKTKTASAQKLGLSKTFNELEFLDRKEYKFLMTKHTSEDPSPTGGANWNEVFKKIFTPWSEDNLYEFLKKFGNYNVTVSHNKTESLGKLNQPELNSYFLSCIEFIQKLNSSYGKILNDGVLTVNSKNYFTFKKEKLDVDNIQNVAPVPSRTKQVISILKRSIEVEISLDNPSYLEALYNVDYREFVLILYWLIHATPEEQTQIGGRIELQIEKSPVFIFKFIKTTE